MSARRRVVAVTLAALCAPVAAASASEAGTTALVSVPTGFVAPFDGVNASLLGDGRQMSGDGRYVVFESFSDGLEPGAADDRGVHCYRRDRVTGETVLIDRADGVDGPIGNQGCSNPTISRDGSAVAFESSSTNLVPGDTNQATDAFFRLVGAGITQRASVANDGTQGTGSTFGTSITVTPSFSPAIGPTVHVAFATDSPLDATHDPGPNRFDVYVRRVSPFALSILAAPTTTLVTRATGANTNASAGSDPSISADGTRIAFVTTASLDAADTGTDLDVYLRDTSANTTTLVSRPDGTAGETSDTSSEPDLSADGLNVSFTSFANNLDPNAGPDANGTRPDIYVRRMATNRTLIASLVNGSATARGNGDNLRSTVSDDGNRVAWLTQSTNLGDGDTTNQADVHVRDLAAGATILASRADGPGGAPAEQTLEGTLSGDGQSVLFDGIARGLAPGAGGDDRQAFVRSLAAGTTRLASGPTGPDTAPFAQLVGDSLLPRADVDDGDFMPPSRRTVSADGRFVVFDSSADGMVGGAGSPFEQVFVRDMLTGETRLVSQTAAGAPGDGDSVGATLSADGSVVAFTTDAPNLGAGPVHQIAVWRRDTGAVTLASVAPGGQPGNAPSLYPSLSDDGTRLAYESTATNLGETPATGVPQGAWWRDLTTGVNRLASRATGLAGAPANAGGRRPIISGDGLRVAFTTAATNLGDGDTDAQDDIHLRDIAAGTTTWVSRRDGPAGTAGNGNSEHPSLNVDGTMVAFDTTATNLVAGDMDNLRDVVIRNLATGANTLASRATGPAGDKGTAGGYSPIISDDGARVAFLSNSPNLVPDDVNGGPDIFLRDLAGQTTTGVSRADGASSALLGVEDQASTADGSPDLHCIAFVSSNPGLVPDGYHSADFTQVYLRTLSGTCLSGAPPTAGGAAGAAAGGPVPVQGAVRAVAGPVLSGVSLRPASFRAGRGRARGATLRFRLSERATVTLTAERKVAGRRKGGRCRTGLRTGRRCTLYRTAGSATLTGKAGANTVRFTGKLGKRTLSPGAYRLRLRPAVGTRLGIPRTVSFRILPAPRLTPRRR